MPAFGSQTPVAKCIASRGLRFQPLVIACRIKARASPAMSLWNSTIVNICGSLQSPSICSSISGSNALCTFSEAAKATSTREISDVYKAIKPLAQSSSKESKTSIRPGTASIYDKETQAVPVDCLWRIRHLSTCEWHLQATHPLAATGQRPWPRGKTRPQPLPEFSRPQSRGRLSDGPSPSPWSLVR